MFGKVKSLIKKSPFFSKVAFKAYDLVINKYQQRKKKAQSFVHMYNVQEIFMQQNGKKGYNRLDTIVSLLAIENEHELNNYGWNLYTKMQFKMGTSEDETVEERIEKFRDIIASWGKNGYDHKSTILLNHNLIMVDGSHELALSIFHGIDKINCRIFGDDHGKKYDTEWFIENDFSKEEIELILAKAEEIIQKNKVRISCIIWPDVKDYFDEIVEKIKLLCTVAEVKDVELSDEAFIQFVKAVYSMNDIEKWKNFKKKGDIRTSVPNKVCYMSLEFDRPEYRYNKSDKKLVLMWGEYIEKIINNCYRNKENKNPSDFVLHIGDNLEQSIFIQKLYEIIDGNSFSFSNKYHVMHLEELSAILEKMGVEKADVCLTGSEILAVTGIRQNHDLDITFCPKIRKEMADRWPKGPRWRMELTDNIELYKNHLNAIGVTDKNIFTKKWYEEYEGYKIIPLEIEYLHKSALGRDKDKTDLIFMELYDPQIQEKCKKYKMPQLKIRLMRWELKAFRFSTRMHQMIQRRA